MNWGAMTPSELASYAPLHATTELERALLEQLERATLDLHHANLQLDEAADDSEQLSSVEHSLSELKDDLYRVLDDEEGDDAQLLKRVREVLEGA